MAAGISSGVEVGGRWHLGGQLGQGAFGQVFRADDTSTLNLGAAAVKVLHPSTSPREREAFHEEIRKVVSLRHPNLVAYLDSGEHRDDDGQPHLFLVTELCRYSLEAYLAGGPGTLTADQSERLLADMSAGLGYLHSRGLLHRDLKPANVLLGGDDWKLGDFGLSRAMSATGHYHHGTVVMGTPRYMAPELFEDGAASAASDVYAVGVTLHQALTGRTVHEGSEVALLVQVTTKPPRIDRDLPPHWRRLIEQCVDREPANRPGASQLPAVLAESRLKPSTRLAQLSGTSPLAEHLGQPLPPPAGARALHPSAQPTPNPAPVLRPSATPAPSVGAPAAGGAGSAAAGAPTSDDSGLDFGVPSAVWAAVPSSPADRPGAPDLAPAGAVDGGGAGAGTPGAGNPGADPAGAAPSPAGGGPSPAGAAPSLAGGGPSPAGGGGGAGGFLRPVLFQAASKPGPNRGLIAGVLVAVAAVVIVGGAVALAGRGGGGNETATTDSTLSGAAQTGNDASATTTGAAGTTVDPATAAAAAQQKVAAITPGQADAPTGYATTLDPDGSPELCTGIQPLRLAKPPLAQSGAAYDSTAQSFVVRTLAYDSVASAQAAYDYAAGLAAACDGQALGADAPDQVWDIAADPTVVVTLAEQSSSAEYTALGGAVSSTMLTIYARAGDVIVQSSGSDRATTIYYAQLALSRLTGQAAPLKVEPAGAVGDLGGGVAGNMRQFLLNSPDSTEGVKAWLGNHTNADIDAIGASACLALNASDTQNQMGVELLAQYSALDPALRGDLSPEDYGQLAGAGAVFYCADEAQRLGLA